MIVFAQVRYVMRGQRSVIKLLISSAFESVSTWLGWTHGWHARRMSETLNVNGMMHMIGIQHAAISTVLTWRQRFRSKNGVFETLDVNGMMHMIGIQHAASSAIFAWRQFLVIFIRLRNNLAMGSWLMIMAKDRAMKGIVDGTITSK